MISDHNTCNIQTRLDEVNASLAEGGENPLRLSQDVAEIREGVGEVLFINILLVLFILILHIITIIINISIIEYHRRSQRSCK